MQRPGMFTMPIGSPTTAKSSLKSAGQRSRFIKLRRKPSTQPRGAKLPTIKELRQEYALLIVQKKEAYKGYREVKQEMQELLKARQNVGSPTAMI